MMTMNRLAAAAALATAAFATFNVHAADERWALHDGLDVGIGFVLGDGAALADTYSFALGAASTLTTTAISIEGPRLDLTGATVSLYQGEVGAGSFVSAFAFDSSAVTSLITPLAAGLYYYLVTGTVGDDAVGGLYALVSRAAPVLQVPEPETAPLLLAGLAAMGFVAARRRRGWLH